MKALQMEHICTALSALRSAAHYGLLGAITFVLLFASMRLLRGTLPDPPTALSAACNVPQGISQPSRWRSGCYQGSTGPILADIIPLPEMIGKWEARDWNWILGGAAVLIFLLFMWAEILRRRIRCQKNMLQEWARREVALKERYKELFENANDIVFTTDMERKLTSVNRAAEELTGYSRNEAINADISDYVAEEYEQLIDQMIKQKLRDAAPTTYNLEIVARDGRRIPLEVSSRLIYADGKPIGIQGIARDITAQKRAELELQKAREAAEAANRAKGEFLANMSHEIRTPLNGIMGMTELALSTDLSDEQREYLSTVKTSGQTLLRVINDILDFSKIEAGRLDLNPTDFDLRDALDDTLKTLSLRAHQKNLELTLHVAPDVPYRVVGDPTRLRQVVVNLVSNAIKFTDRGEVILDVTMELQTAEELFVRFTVTDTGIGIPPNKQRLIFAPFTQADSSSTRRYGGTGLGLAISFQLVELMGGHLWVESEEGKGSCFQFTACFRPSASGSQVTLPLDEAGLEGLAALVVDDNATNRRVLEELLSGWGMKPVLADGARTSLAVLEHAKTAGKPFPLVLIDACMPDMDGFTLAERINKDPGLDGAKIMMLTSAGRQGDAARCRELGIAAYLHKPISARGLFQAILLAVSPDRKEARDAELITRHALREKRVSLQVLLVEDDPVNRQLAEHLLRRSGCEVTVAQNGREALKAIQASGSNGFDIALMDVQMPELDGLEATAAIRAVEKNTAAHLPIVAMTAHAMKGDRARFLKAGMDGYIAKPIQFHQLLTVIEELSPGTGKRRPEYNQEVSPKPPIDRKLGLARLEGDSELFRDLLRLFAREAPAALSRLRDAVERKNADAIRHASHTLRGSLSNLSAEEAIQAASVLETMARDGNLENSEDAARTLEKEVRRVLAAIETPESEVAG